jgi:hypothetical protein
LGRRRPGAGVRGAALLLSAGRSAMRPLQAAAGAWG